MSVALIVLVADDTSDCGSDISDCATSLANPIAESEIEHSGDSGDDSPSALSAVVDSTHVASPPPPPQSFTRPELLATSRFGFLGQQLEDEARDNDWAPAMEVRILQGFSALNLPFSLIQVHCRTTICRIEMAISEANQQDEEAYFEQLADSVLAPILAEKGRVTAASGVDASAQTQAGFSTRQDIRVGIAYLYRGEALPVTPERQQAIRAVEQYRILDARGAIAGQDPVVIEVEGGSVTILRPPSDAAKYPEPISEGLRPETP